MRCTRARNSCSVRVGLRCGRLDRACGSQCNSEGYRWKRFRGPAYDREPFDGTWYHKFASPGWRIFEFLDMCEAADIHPVVTMNNKETPEDMADFVEDTTTRIGLVDLKVKNPLANQSKLAMPLLAWSWNLNRFSPDV